MQKCNMLIKMFVDLININQWLIIYTDQKLKTLLAY